MQSLEHISKMLVYGAQEYNNQPKDLISGKSYYCGMVHAHFLILGLPTELYHEGIDSGTFDIEKIKVLLSALKVTNQYKEALDNLANR